MKISKWEALICLAAALFLAFCAGWTVRAGREAVPLRVEAQRALAVTETAFPPPTPEPEREKLDLNTATAEQLQELPGIGEKRAADIIADREENGPFRFPEDLARVKGIGEQTVAGVLDYITVTEEEP